MPLTCHRRLARGLAPWAGAAALVCGLLAAAPALAQKVRLDTTLGEVVIELDAQRAPKTVANFLEYVRSGHYDGTVFHRVIPGFMIQGGGFDAQLQQKPTRAPIALESRNGLVNARGTVAMARTNVADSATAQFFINLKDNDFLNQAQARDGQGYAVFGKVVAGMDVVDAIAAVPTTARGMHRDVPASAVTIRKASVEK